MWEGLNKIILQVSHMRVKDSQSKMNISSSISEKNSQGIRQIIVYDHIFYYRAVFTSYHNTAFYTEAVLGRKSFLHWYK